MSIWATQWATEIPPRTKYGEPDPGEKPGDVYVCTSGMSTVLRLTVDDPPISSTVSYLTPDEARQIAAALISAADATDAANKADAARI